MIEQILKFLQSNNVFLSGGAGVGKSFITQELIQRYKNQGKNVIALGSTAIAALNIGGVTLHSFFALGHCSEYSELLAYDRRQREKLVKLREILKKIDLIIIDEISMVRASVLDLIAYRLENSNFKGKILVVGDFFQLPPVIKKSEQIDSKNLFNTSVYAFASFAWEGFEFVNIALSIAKRTSDTEFYMYLSILRKGIFDVNLVNYFQKFLSTKKDLKDNFTLICSMNKTANNTNLKELAKLPSELLEFKAQIAKIDENLDDQALSEWVQSLNALQELQIKIGAKIIFCVNNFDAGYYNGEQGLVLDFFENFGQKYLKILKNNGEIITIEPYVFTLKELNVQGDQVEEQIRAKMAQFPIKLAYAITIHKSQGMSIKNLVCDIDHIFEKGQLYVALSRATDPEYLKIFCSQPENFEHYFKRILKFNPEVTNFYQNTQFINLEEGQI